LCAPFFGFLVLSGETTNTPCGYFQLWGTRDGTPHPTTIAKFEKILNDSPELAQSIKATTGYRTDRIIQLLTQNKELPLAERKKREAVVKTSYCALVDNCDHDNPTILELSELERHLKAIKECYGDVENDHTIARIAADALDAKSHVKEVLTRVSKEIETRQAWALLIQQTNVHSHI
jgi:hypothetical protein